MIILADYNLNRQAILISGSLAVSGLLDLVNIQVKTFEDLSFPVTIRQRSICLEICSDEWNAFTHGKSECKGQRLTGTDYA